MKIHQVQAKCDDFKIRSPVTKLGGGVGRGKCPNFKFFNTINIRIQLTNQALRPHIRFTRTL